MTRRIIPTLGIFLAWTLSISAQTPTPTPLATPPVNHQLGILVSQPATEPCTLTLDQAPAVKGLRLGMSEEQAAAKVARSFSADLEEPIYLRGVKVRMNHEAGFESVLFVTMQSFDSKVSLIRIAYDVMWDDPKEFVDNFGPKLGIPVGAFSFERATRTATAACNGFDLELTALNYAELRLTDTSIPRKIAKLKDHYEEDKKKAIKP